MPLSSPKIEVCSDFFEIILLFLLSGHIIVLNVSYKTDIQSRYERGFLMRYDCRYPSPDTHIPLRLQHGDNVESSK